MGKEIVGTCRLCLTANSHLQDGHIIPSWSFRRVRDDQAPGNMDPVILDGRRIWQTSRQFTEHMLCFACEQRVGKMERWMSERVYSQDGIPIPLQLLRVQPGAREVPFVIPLVPDLDSGKLAYFASSVFWRSSIATNPMSGQAELGDHYQEQFRLYLNNEADFPSKARLTLDIMDPSGQTEQLKHMTIAFPATLNQGGFHSHSFFLLGLHFQLYVGNQGISRFDRSCLHRAKEKIAIVRSWRDMHPLQDAKRKAPVADPSKGMKKYLNE